MGLERVPKLIAPGGRWFANREIGVLRALGGSRWRIRRAMLDETS